VCALIVLPRARRRAEQLLMATKASARWMSPPDAAAIRAADLARLDHDPAMTVPASDEELGLVAALLASHGPEAVAAALLRLHRARLPPPAELAVQAEPTERREMGPTRWFRLSIGRAQNADPKWLLPLLCRLGQVTRKDIGAIRIEDRETRFELVAGAVEGFLAALEGAELDGLRITADEAGPPARDEGRADGPRRFHPNADAPRDGKPRPYKPYAGKRTSEATTDGKPAAGKPFRKPYGKPGNKPRRDRAAAQ
jgi:ATP-dependent RNA helicase DeaD